MTTELILGFIAGLAVGIAIIGIMAVQVTMKLRETIAVLQVDLRYARKECDHHWAAMDNEVITGGEFCTKCLKIK